MNEEAKAYLEYLLEAKEFEKPEMPKFDLLAYNDNEYTLAVLEIEKEFEECDDLYLTIKYLQGE